MKRRNFLTATAGAGALYLVSGSLQQVLAQNSGPIRIGLLAPLTGTAASSGRELVDGWNMFWQEHGLKLGGRAVEVIVEDDASNPDTALQKARRLVQQQNVHMLVGNVLANTGLAVAEFVKGTGTPYFMPVVAADDLTQRTRIPNVLRVAGFAASQMTRPLADWCRKKGYKRVVTIGQDYTFGHEQAGGFIQNFTEGGGVLAGQLWHPLNTSDFSPYMGQIQSFTPDVVLAIETGADAARLLQQWSNFGLKNTIPLVTSQNTTDQSVIRNLSAAEVEGIVSCAHYAEGRDDPSIRKFVDAYENSYKKIPSIFAAEGYTAAIWIADAVSKMNGQVEDRKRLLDTIMKDTIADSPLGKNLKMDAYGNPVYTIYIRKVARRADGKLVNTVIDTYPNVSQFGRLKPEEYLKQPPFSRQFQGVQK
ncbi:MAG TPA: ABC transporter substrate-binding protein [Burkholderiaceae bacterium]|jgi:branched-chain amino acid transport system substrate-binding protein|nr:ABC transporter substrate-binding protein [Burkholderiaceae bacterium]